MVENDNLINPEEIEDFYKNLRLIIDDVDCTNPLKVYSFANSLINIGTYFLNGAYSKLLSKGFNEHEIKKFQEAQNNNFREDVKHE